MTTSLRRAAAAGACLFAVVTSLAAGATYYVDYAAGSDGGNGSPQAPFRHCPGDAEAQGRAATATLRSGDVVVFKGGVTYEGTISCRSDGVTYDGNSADRFGRGPAVISGRHGELIEGFTAREKHDLTFQYFDLADFGGHGATPESGQERHRRPGYGIYLDQCSRVRISYCRFREIGDWQNVPNANSGYMEGIGVAVINAGQAITVTRCEFTRLGRAGIMIQPKLGDRTCTDIRIAENNFHEYLRWGVWLATGNTGCTLNGVTIENNRFHDIYQYAPGLWQGQPGAAPHVDCIIAYIGSLPPQGGQTLGTAARPIVIRGNFFYNDAAVARVQNSAVFLDTWGGRVLIYDNVFVNTLYNGNGAVFCLEGTNPAINPPPDYWICNNSFCDTTYAVTLESFRYPLHSGAIHILNNIFDKPDAGAGYSVRIMDPKSLPTELDYDLYDTGRPDDRVAVYCGSHRTLPELQSLGYERHGRRADPHYWCASVGAVASSMDLHLRGGSPAIGSARNLSSLFAVDKDGQKRPSAPAAWDTGAYVSSSATLP